MAGAGGEKLRVGLRGECTLVALTWLPECCQPVGNRTRGRRVWGRKLSCSRHVGLEMPLRSQGGKVKQRVVY